MKDITTIAVLLLTVLFCTYLGVSISNFIEVQEKRVTVLEMKVETLEVLHGIKSNGQ